MYETTRELSPHTRFANIWGIAQEGQPHPDALCEGYKYQLGTVQDHDKSKIGVIISSYEDPYVGGSLRGRDRIMVIDFETGHSLALNESALALTPDQLELLERLDTFESVLETFEPDAE